MRILSDAAAEQDQLEFSRYVDPIVSLLADAKAKPPLTIGVFGTWGSGKTTLLSLIDQALEKKYSQKFVRVHFYPWLHRHETNMLIPLLHTLRDTLEESLGARVTSSVKKLTDILFRLSADIVLKAVTLDAVSVENLDKLEQKYVDAKGRVDSQIRKLHSILRQEITALAADGSRLVLFIDDLDRCEPNQIIDVLEAIKLFFDLPHTFVILAVDKEVIDRGIEVRYGQFKFAGGREAFIGTQYLEKMVQVPLHLFPLSSTHVKAMLAPLKESYLFGADVTFLAEAVEPNPRKLKRILNVLSVVEAMKPSGLNAGVMARIVVLRIQEPLVYDFAAQDSDFLLALERVYTGDIKNVNDNVQFLQYNSRWEAVQAFCKQHYKPASRLAKLFGGAPFASSGDLVPYFSMVGV